MYTIHSIRSWLRSSLLLGRIDLLFTSRRALPARRLAALGARADLSTDCWRPLARGQTGLLPSETGSRPAR